MEPTLQEKDIEGPKMHHINSLKTLIFTAPVALVTLLGANPAHAQMEYMAEIMQPEYMTRDLVLFAEGLQLDDMQEVIIEGFFDDYEDDFAAGWAATQERINEVALNFQAKEGGTDLDKLEPVLNALGDWVVGKRQLDDGLLENIKVILLPEQQMLWPAFAQRLYREKNIRKGRLSGESVDLFQIARDTNLPSAAESAIDPHLEEYAIALDIALRNRDAILRGNPKKLFDKILSGNNQKSADLVDSSIKARVEVRDITDRYIYIIGENLAAADRKDFITRALKRGYTRIYRRTPAQRLLRQAAENESYDEGLRAQIIQLEYAYLQELSVINLELLEKTRTYEPALQKNRELAGQIRKSGGTPQKLEDPTRALYKEREDLGEQYIEMLQTLLTPEQFLELDGSRRWAPREEQLPTSQADPTNNKYGGLTPLNPDGVKDDIKGKHKPREAGSKTGVKSGSGLGGGDR